MNWTNNFEQFLRQLKRLTNEFFNNLTLYVAEWRVPKFPRYF